MRLAWVRNPATGDWRYRSGKYQLLVGLAPRVNSQERPIFLKAVDWLWTLSAGLNSTWGYEPDEHQARAAAEMALDDLLAADEEQALERANRYAPTQPSASAPSPQPQIRVYFDGCEGSGKTTLARRTARRYGLPLLTEVASGVLYEFQQRVGERASSWERIRADVELSSEVQARVFQRQLEDERALPPPAVYDRTLSCLAYAELYADNFSALLERVPPEYIENLRQSVVFLVRPQRDLLGSSDGVRAVVSWENQIRVDQNIEMLLNMWHVPFVSVDSLNAAARQRAVDWCMRSRGFARVTQGAAS